MISKRARRVCVLISFVWLVKLKVVIEKCRKKGRKQGSAVLSLSTFFFFLGGWEHGCHGNQHKL